MCRLPVPKAVPVAFLLLSCGSASRAPAAQAFSLELDHFYLVVPPPLANVAAALREAGLVLDSEVDQHEGEGTASIGAFFENTYLELLWVDSSVAVDSAHRSALSDFVRAATWRHSGASPFGIALHFLAGSEADLPVPTRRDPAPHLGPNIFYLLLRQPEESLAADIFVMPPGRAATSWLPKYQSRRPDLFAHPMGVHRLTRLVVHGPPTNRPHAADLTLRLVRFEPAERSYLTVEFDDRQQKRVRDLRPVLPILFEY